MCDNSSALQRTAADYAEAERRESIYARQEAIRIAHSSEIPAAEVVERAEAYFAFIAG